MRGVKYNLTFNKKQGDDITFENIDIKQMKENINKIFLDEFGIEFNCSRNHVYNVLHRPNTSNIILKSLFKIEKV